MREAPQPHGGSHPQALDRTGYELAFDEHFAGSELDPERWVARCPTGARTGRGGTAAARITGARVWTAAEETEARR